MWGSWILLHICTWILLHICTWISLHICTWILLHVCTWILLHICIILTSVTEVIGCDAVCEAGRQAFLAVIHFLGLIVPSACVPHGAIHRMGVPPARQWNIITPPCNRPPLTPPPPLGNRHFHVCLVNIYLAGMCYPSALHMALHCFPIT